ncbi:MAG: DinB family protein [Chloroflexota bacterium]
MQSKSDIITTLQQEADAITQTINTLSDVEFVTGTDERWSAEGYLKHLILSVKPFASGLKLPPEQLAKRFGTTDNGSMSYQTLVDKYEEAMQSGVRAESTPNVVPVNYRFPDDVSDERAHLVSTWAEANQRLINALENWSEDALDTHQLPHPAMGMITIREMCFFTVHHNQYHHGDIKTSAQLANT